MSTDNSLHVYAPAGVELRTFAEEQAFAAVGGDPRQYLRAVKGDEGGGAFVAQAEAGGVAEVDGFVRQGHAGVMSAAGFGRNSIAMVCHPGESRDPF